MLAPKEQAPFITATRVPANPILTPERWGHGASAVFNPAVTRVGDEVYMVARVEDRRGQSHLGVARTLDPEGVADWEVDREVRLQPAFPEEGYGLEDPRVTYLSDEDLYVLSYTAYGPGGPGVALALTRDFRHFERLGMVLAPEDKNAVLFPRRIGGRYAMLHRPLRDGGRGIWLSFSDDLVRWRDSVPVLMPRRGWWDEARIGSGPPPLLTSAGWLLVYHGVRETVAGTIYRAGFAILDAEEPWRVRYRHPEWILAPQAPYERVGDVPNVVFPTGMLVLPGGKVRLFYGAADTVIAAADVDVDSLLAGVASALVATA